MQHCHFSLALGLLSLYFLADGAQAEVKVITGGQSVAEIVVDTSNAKGNGPALLKDAGSWLSEALEQASGAKLALAEKIDDQSAIVIARADAHQELAKAAGLKSGDYNGYCIITQPKAVYILGGSEIAANYGVAEVLRNLGFRWFAPSPRWHYVPKLKDVSIDLQIHQTPALIDRRMWYAYGMRGDDLKPLMENYQRWAIANRLSVGTVIQTGHSYGNIVSRNKEAFDQHPEYFALLPDGSRDNQRSILARKFCFSNPDLIKLVIEDRIKLLETQQKVNPAARMISMDPSDGQGTCHCENCEKLGTTTDRVIYLANQVAKGIRKRQPDAWVGLYAYSSHRLPPTIDVEPNVYVQVAMGFNRTPYTLPELVSMWSEKVGAVGLREYYGVEAWDWGLPGRMRGSHASYHRKWIPFYAKRKLNAVNAETNANWGGQTLGLYIASQLAWNPEADVDALINEFYELNFGPAAEPMRRLYERFDNAPPLRPATLLPMFDDVQQSWKLADNDEVRARLTDLMAYLVYVAEFRKFDLARGHDPDRGDLYYAALKKLMTYAWRIRLRDTVHYYALARRLCNGLPVTDKRLEFYIANKEQAPVWQTGEPMTDAEIQKRFEQTIASLKSDGDPTVFYSRYFEKVRLPGENVGGSRFANHKETGVARFRRSLRGYLVPSGQQEVTLSIAPVSREATIVVYVRGETELFRKSFRLAEGDKPGEAFHDALIELPKPGEYRVQITGDFALKVPPETPFMFEASVLHPAWIDYSGPHYFYVPRGTKELMVDGNPRLSLYLPGQKQRLDITPATRQEGSQYSVIKVPEGSDGQLWHTWDQTRGVVSLLNVPPLMSFHPQPFFVPREVSEAGGLSTEE